MRREHFQVAGENLNGTRRATITIEVGEGIALFTVRPYRRGTTYTLPLEVVAKMVMWSVAKAQAAQARISRRRVRRGR